MIREAKREHLTKLIPFTVLCANSVYTMSLESFLKRCLFIPLVSMGIYEPQLQRRREGYTD
jgi:hypothetical protein